MDKLIMNKKVFLTTYGWPMGALPYDFGPFFEEYIGR